ncbi:hypothetical protein ECDEC8D_4225 [Escherichia coli DEC8D]|uniref:Uncharacterized protein n=1 Tax=Escherichia coli TaxID=562 RepID=A0A2H4TUT9_ECOLX|nr:hypothetical protein CV83915_03034 [Escherichia coli]AUP45249.1 hypothetical protein CV83906_2662 [Escherichia coli]EHW22228.1 hypothetical protein ECDEC8D_4225 [Escherichia coli DEC8D]EHW41523.1 hypothetical protein ECDEC9A_1193 [Escherichia coli DEC9A]EHW54106.1 hypothetical protein ECDEC9E_4055 [Escherichia coli DEC9E]
MRITVPHKHHPDFLNTGHGDKRTMIISVSLNQESQPPDVFY